MYFGPKWFLLQFFHLKKKKRKKEKKKKKTHEPEVSKGMVVDLMALLQLGLAKLKLGWIDRHFMEEIKREKLNKSLFGYRLLLKIENTVIK